MASNATGTSRKERENDDDEGSISAPNPKRAKFDEGNSIAVTENLIIDRLPDEILIKIISNLSMTQWPSLELVDKKFRKAVHGAWRLVRKFRFDDDILIKTNSSTVHAGDRIDSGKSASDIRSILTKLIDRAPHITSMVDIPLEILSDDCRSTFAQFDSLEILNFRGGSIVIHELADFLQTSASRSKLNEWTIKKFSLSSASALGHRRDDYENLQAALGESNLKLEKLRLEFDEVNIFNFLKLIDASRLKTLHLIDYKFDTNLFIDLIRRCVCLENLAFNFQKPEAPINRQLFPVVSALEQLSSLKIGRSASGIVSRNHHGQLEFLQMIKDLGKRRRLTEFSVLDTYWSNEQMLESIGGNLTHLTSLEFSAVFLRPELFIRLATKLKLLEKLRVVFPQSSIDGIDSEVISAMAAHLFDLKYLYIDFEESIATKCFSSIFNDLCLSSTLKELRIVGATILPSTFLAWGDGFGGSLESIELPYCDQIADRDLITFIARAPRLRRLNLKKAEITDRGLKAIASLCPHLRELDLTSCRKITAKGVQSVLDGCRLLTKLKLDENGDQFFGFLTIEKYKKISFS